MRKISFVGMGNAPRHATTSRQEQGLEQPSSQPRKNLMPCCCRERSERSGKHERMVVLLFDKRAPRRHGAIAINGDDFVRPCFQLNWSAGCPPTLRQKALPKIRHRALVGVLFALARQLRERDHRDAKFLRQRIECARDGGYFGFCSPPLPTMRAAGNRRSAARIPARALICRAFLRTSSIRSAPCSSM